MGSIVIRENEIFVYIFVLVCARIDARIQGKMENGSVLTRGSQVPVYLAMCGIQCVAKKNKTNKILHSIQHTKKFTIHYFYCFDTCPCEYSFCNAVQRTTYHKLPYRQGPSWVNVYVSIIFYHCEDKGSMTIDL